MMEKGDGSRSLSYVTYAANGIWKNLDAFYYGSLMYHNLVVYILRICVL